MSTIADFAARSTRYWAYDRHYASQAFADTWLPLVACQEIAGKRFSDCWRVIGTKDQDH